ncbi:unnamed protein product, partial [Mesorhabditis belari]|uniref:Uncharacterized protein n=1 Tax=Mesorhabditis belari TaxID=2138241 RepID=A0AAF3J998_9BILA
MNSRYSPPLKTWRVKAIIVNQHDRLHFLRTPKGSAVLNDSSKNEEQNGGGKMIGHNVTCGDFLEVTLRESGSVRWSESNPYLVLSYRKIPPPPGISVTGYGKDIKIECITHYSGFLRNDVGDGLDIFTTSFVDRIYDFDCVTTRILKNDHYEDAEYLMELKIGKVRQRNGEELIVSRLIDFWFPERRNYQSQRNEDSTGFLNKRLREEMNYERRERRERREENENGYNSTYSSANSIRNESQYLSSRGSFDDGESTRNEISPPPPRDTMDESSKEEEAKRLFLRWWSNPEMRRVLHAKDSKLVEEIQRTMAHNS